MAQIWRWRDQDGAVRSVEKVIAYDNHCPPNNFEIFLEIYPINRVYHCDGKLCDSAEDTYKIGPTTYLYRESDQLVASATGETLCGSDLGTYFYLDQYNLKINLGPGNDVVKTSNTADTRAFLYDNGGNDWYFLEKPGEVIVDRAGDDNYIINFPPVNVCRDSKMHQKAFGKNCRHATFAKYNIQDEEGVDTLVLMTQRPHSLGKSSDIQCKEDLERGKIELWIHHNLIFQTASAQCDCFFMISIEPYNGVSPIENIQFIDEAIVPFNQICISRDEL